MRIFNLAEELEKERKKNKELQEDVNKYVCYYRYVKMEKENLQEKINKAISMLELSGGREKISKDFVNIGRKRYDEILSILKGE